VFLTTFSGFLAKFATESGDSEKNNKTTTKFSPAERALSRHQLGRLRG
jgi:hypothetical protein